jgi:hypothetical protein
LVEIIAAVLVYTKAQNDKTGAKMIKNLSDYLSGIAIGVRYRPNFIIEDKAGEIVDSILYPENSLFNPKVFPEVETSFGGKTLINQKTEDKIQIDKANFIVEVNFKEESVLTKEDAKSIIENFETQILRGTLQKFKIESIIRIGYLQKFTVEDEDLKKEIY